MSTIQFANDAKTTLAAPLTDTATTLQVAGGTGALFPALVTGQYFSLTIKSAANGLIKEIVKCTAINGDALTIVRAQEGTNNLPWNAGDIVGNVLTAGQMAAMAQSSDLASSFFTGTDTGTANALSVSATLPTNNNPVAGQTFLVTKGPQNNTGAVTLKIPSTAPTAAQVLTADGNNLGSGAWPGNSTALLRYNGTVYQLVGLLVPNPGLYTGNDSSSTTNAIVANDVNPPLNSYAEGQRFQIKLANDITGPCTANLDGSGVINVTRADNSPTKAGDGRAGEMLDLICDGTRLQIAGLTSQATGGRLLNTQILTAAGTSTYTPTPGLPISYIIVTVEGAGAAGAGTPNPGQAGYFAIAGGGGGGGAAQSKLLLSTPGVNGASCTVGAKGVAVAGNVQSAAGGDTTFGNFLTGGGGQGTGGNIGIVANGTATFVGGGAGGTATGGNIYNKVGSSGGLGGGSSTANLVGGSGGTSANGGAGANSRAGAGAGNAAMSVGAGGGGGCQVNANGSQIGGNGADGKITIQEWS